MISALAISTERKGGTVPPCQLLSIYGFADGANKMQNNFYVYLHRKADTGGIFYVGKGKDGRDVDAQGRNSFWRNTVKKHGYVVTRIEENVSEEQAHDFEKLLIAEIGRRDLNRGPLVNLTDGGEGISGYLFSEQAKAKISAAHSRPETKEKHAAAIREALSRPETKAKHSAAMNRPETKAKMSASLREAFARPEVKAKMSAAIRDAHARPETRAKMSASAREARARPGVRAKMSAASRAAQARPEVKAKKSAAIRAALANPETKAKMSASLREALNRPETKAKCSASAREARALKKEYCAIHGITAPGTGYCNIDKADFQRWLKQRSEQSAA